jgi:hypothetical protein
VSGDSIKEKKMAAVSKAIGAQKPNTAVTDTSWRSLYTVGGMAALIAVLAGVIENVITFLPGGGHTVQGSVTVIDWFALFQSNWFIALRNLGLLNIVIAALAIPIFFSLYAAHRQVNQAYAAFAMIMTMLGVAVFLATNRAFPMLDLGNQYAAVTTDAQKTALAAAGQAMLSVGQSHRPGTFMGFFLSEVAVLIMSLVMLQGRIFSKATAYAGMLGFAFLSVFEICSSFVPALFDSAMLFALVGGLLAMAWYVLIARRLFQLGQSALNEGPNRN